MEDNKPKLDISLPPPIPSSAEKRDVESHRGSTLQPEPLPSQEKTNVTLPPATTESGKSSNSSTDSSSRMGNDIFLLGSIVVGIFSIIFIALFVFGEKNTYQPIAKSIPTTNSSSGFPFPVPDQAQEQVRKAVPIPKADSDSDKTCEILSFLSEYINSGNTGSTMRHESSYYAPYVDYFAEGIVTQEYIKNDIEKYYVQWPFRNSIAKDILPIVRLYNDTYLILFTLDFTVSDGKNTRTGPINCQVVVTRINNEWKVTIVKHFKTKK